MKKIISFLVVVVMLVTLLPNVSFALSNAELQAQITALMAQIKQLQAQLDSQSGSNTFCYTFNKNLKITDNNVDVSNLRTALSKEGISIAQGSNDFDEEVASAVSEFQEKYKSEILIPVNLTRGNGYVGAKTRAKLNALYGCAVNPPSGNNLPPVINSFTSPTTLNVGQNGKWTIVASDPENSSLTYNITYGDENMSPSSNSSINSGFTQTTTFIHSYASAGSYTVTITVKDEQGLTTQASVAVSVGGVVSNQPTINFKVNGKSSDTVDVGSTPKIEWTSTGITKVRSILKTIKTSTCDGDYNGRELVDVSWMPTTPSASVTSSPIPTCQADSKYSITLSGTAQNPVSSTIYLNVNALISSARPSQLVKYTRLGSETIFIISPDGKSKYGFATWNAFVSWGYTYGQVVDANDVEKNLPEAGIAPEKQSGCSNIFDQIKNTCGFVSKSISLTAHGANSIITQTGKSLSFKWNSTGVKSVSTFRKTIKANSCIGQYDVVGKEVPASDWVQAVPTSSYTTLPIDSCYAGSEYDVTIKDNDSNIFSTVRVAISANTSVGTLTLTANGLDNLTVITGQPLKFNWGINGVSAPVATKKTIIKSSCVGDVQGQIVDASPWVDVNTKPTGEYNISATDSCLAGGSYEITLKDSNPSSMVAPKSVYVKFVAPQTSNINLSVNGLNNRSYELDTGVPVTFSWNSSGISTVEHSLATLTANKCSNPSDYSGRNIVSDWLQNSPSGSVTKTFDSCWAGGYYTLAIWDKTKPSTVSYVYIKFKSPVITNRSISLSAKSYNVDSNWQKVLQSQSSVVNGQKQINVYNNQVLTFDYTTLGINSIISSLEVIKGASLGGCGYTQGAVYIPAPILSGGQGIDFMFPNGSWTELPLLPCHVGAIYKYTFKDSGSNTTDSILVNVLRDEKLRSISLRANGVDNAYIKDGQAINFVWSSDKVTSFLTEKVTITPNTCGGDYAGKTESPTDWLGQTASGSKTVTMPSCYKGSSYAVYFKDANPPAENWWKAADGFVVVIFEP